MKKVSFFTGIICLIFFLFVYNITDAQIFKWIRVGKNQMKIFDHGHQSETAGGCKIGYYYWDDFKLRTTGPRNLGSRFGTVDWTDENGKYWPVKLAGAPYGTSDEVNNMFTIPDDEGITIRRYWRYTPPSIVVDGVILNEPFPQTGDEVSPDKIPGNADVMVESWMRTWMGVSVHQRVFGWNQTYHDEYIIFDWTFTNTGNVDRDEEIELGDQTLKELYFMRSGGYFPNRGTKKEWSSWYGENPGDTLRIMYNYSHRAKGADYDDFGSPRVSQNGFLRGPKYLGEATLHVDKSADDPTDDITQPQMHTIWSYRILALKHESGRRSPEEHLFAYEVMKEGLHFDSGVPYAEGTYPGTYHEVKPEERGYKFVDEFPGWGGAWHTIIFNSSGPYTLKPGESIRTVWSTVWGNISIKKAWEVGGEWYNGTLEPPPGMTFGVTDNLPAQYKAFPELYAADKYASEYTNWAKDCWVATGRDSLFNNAWASQWSVRNDYNIPIPPPPPSIEIKSLPDRINISWGNESEAASDFAGYRVYRAIPYADSCFFYPVFECGKGTNSYDDMDASRGVGYLYYVAAFDDGIGNIPGVNGKKESLESGRYLNQTTRAAYLTRPFGTLSTVRVVPNPFNISAEELQYPGEENKIMFMDIPAYCTIKIYTESGDLIKTLYHTDGSGDESWGKLWQEHSATEDGQRVVSGIYIAYIEQNDAEGNPTGESTALKFVIVR